MQNLSKLNTFIGTSDAKNAAWTCNGGKPQKISQGKFIGYDRFGREVNTDSDVVLGISYMYDDEDKCEYKIALDKNRRILDPKSDDRRSDLTPCSKEEFVKYVRYLQTGQRQYLQQLRGQLPRIR